MAIDSNFEVKEGINPDHYEYGFSLTDGLSSVETWYSESQSVPLPEGEVWLFMRSLFDENEVYKKLVTISCDSVDETCAITYDGLSKTLDSGCRIEYSGISKQGDQGCLISFDGFNKNGVPISNTNTGSPRSGADGITGNDPSIVDGTLIISMPPGDASLIAVQLVRVAGNFYWVKDISTPKSGKMFFIDSHYWVNDLAAVQFRKGWPVLVQVYFPNLSLGQSQWRTNSAMETELSFVLY